MSQGMAPFVMDLSSCPASVAGSFRRGSHQAAHPDISVPRLQEQQ